MDLIASPKGENNGRIRSWGTFLGSEHFGVEWHAGALGWGLGGMRSKLTI
jgi:hypothetical protein